MREVMRAAAVIAVAPFLCVAAVSAESVEVTSVSGNAQVLLQGAHEYAVAEEGMELEAGDKVKTDANSSAEISFNENNSNVVRLSGGTETEILLNGDEKLQMSEGEVFASVGDLEAGSAFEIRTPTAVSGARGTDWITKVSGDETEVEAVDDMPYVRHMEESGRISTEITRIPPGKMTMVKKFHRPVELRNMHDARRQQFLQEKQNIRRRAAQALIKRGERPKFDRKDFMENPAGKKISPAMEIKQQSTQQHKDMQQHKEQHKEKQKHKDFKNQKNLHDMKQLKKKVPPPARPVKKSTSAPR